MPYRDVPDVPALRDLLNEQDGVVSVAQLKTVGVAPDLARARVRAGRWQRPHLGVYAVFSGELDRRAKIWAAILRCGPEAVASHQTAAELDGLTDQSTRHVHVTLPWGRHVRISRNEGIRVHYSSRLYESRHPAKLPPRTRLEETVLDLVATSNTIQMAAAWITVAVRKRLSTPARLGSALRRRKKFRWRRLVSAMLGDVAEGAYSGLELEHLWKVQRAHGLPRGIRQRKVVSGGRVIWVDLDLEEFRLRIELDGSLGHVDEGAFRDRRRDNRATVSGLSTLRYGHAEVFGTPCEVAAEEAKVLRDHGWNGEPRMCGTSCSMTP
jgi:very-short-patch-repair endonuclease